ncbi:DUF1801 domain-containing protein [Tenacibaculum tangerinum]|uniref:DUF1801 domain-containing protein n=1 Tax=Tenacibaculum tangerinum TaxID=3038772 RepID=A0ABY8L4L1_9FLAO|nr:DUF1801 domain-containing protein [Tenacibaculum tangerinum]WGH74840.1 DUF1801 domain-containing protein [Tenacibaculum tangerinum]
MKYEATTVAQYISLLPDERQRVVEKLRAVILENLPKGFEEGINCSMICYYVPHSKYPNGYHCNPKLPLPFMNLASQKNSVNLYHSGIYAKKELHDWFVAEYSKQSTRKPDMGKSCIRLKKTDAIPYELIAELCAKITVDEWISIYESRIKIK